MWAFYSALQAALDLLRQCPKCGHKQKVRLLDKHKTVKCAKCSTPLPPNQHKM